LVHRWSTKTRVSDKCCDLQGQRSSSQGHVTRLTGVDRERNILETPKLVGRLRMPQTIMRTSFKVKTEANIMLRPEVSHILRTEGPTNFKIGVQVEFKDPYRLDGPSPARSKVKVAMSRGVSDRCWPRSLEQKVPETSKLFSRLRMQ